MLIIDCIASFMQWNVSVFTDRYLYRCFIPINMYKIFWYVFEIFLLMSQVRQNIKKNQRSAESKKTFRNHSTIPSLSHHAPINPFPSHSPITLSHHTLPCFPMMPSHALSWKSNITLSFNALTTPLPVTPSHHVASIRRPSIDCLPFITPHHPAHHATHVECRQPTHRV